jgi:hypothetical protein
MEGVKEPSPKCDGVCLFVSRELTLGSIYDGLKEFVRGYLAFKCPGVPHLPHELAESSDKI